MVDTTDASKLILCGALIKIAMSLSPSHLSLSCSCKLVSSMNEFSHLNLHVVVDA